MNCFKLRTRSPLRWMALALVAVMLTACGTTPDTPQPIAAPTNTGAAAGSTATTAPSGGNSSATEVVFWHQLTGNDAKTIDQIAADFNAKNPDVHVKSVSVPGNETDVTKLMTAVRGGTGPDVYFFNRPFVAERAASGILTDLTSYVQKNNLLDNYLEFTHQEVTFKNKVYALPFDTDVRALYYNKALLKEAGVDPAEFDQAKGPLSLTRVAEIAAKIDQRDASGAYTRVGFIPWLEQGWHYTWGFAFGGSFYDIAACKVTPTDPGVVKGFQFMYDWAKRMDPQKVKAFIDTYLPQNAPPASHPFLTGKVGMMVTGDWMLAQIRDYAPSLDYGVTYIPVPESGKVTSWSAGWSLVMPTGAKHPDAAFRFMQYMTGPDGQRRYVQQTAHLPTWKALLDDNSLYQADHQFLRTLLPKSTSLPPVPAGAAYWDALTTAQQQVTQNLEDPTKALQTAFDTVQPKVAPLCGQ